MFGENLKAARKAKGMTQEELAARLHVVRQTISKWEKGLSVPDADQLIRLSVVLEVPASKLLGAKTEFEREDTDAMADQLSQINEQLAGRTIRTRRLAKTLLAVVVKFFAYVFGATIEIQPNPNLPGFGVLSALLTMGGFISSYVLEK